MSWGVLSFGVSFPKAPMELGVNTAQLLSLAMYRELVKAPILMSQASFGFFSPVADNKATKLKMVSILYFFTMALKPSPSRAFNSSNGPASANALHFSALISAATTLLFP